MTSKTMSYVATNLSRQILKSLKAVWEFNQDHWCNPLIWPICFSVVFHVIGALFPPIEQNCAVITETRSINQTHEEGLLP